MVINEIHCTLIPIGIYKIIFRPRELIYFTKIYHNLKNRYLNFN